MTNFPWFEQLNLNMDINWQVNTFTEIFLNIWFVPRDPPWITKPIKTMLNRKNRLFKNYKKHRYKDEDLRLGSTHFVLNVKRQSQLQNQLTQRT